MKKVISVFLALVMCLSLAVPAFADWNDVHPQGGTVDWGPKEPDMCLTLPTEIVVYDDRSGNYTVGAAEVRNAGKAKATITDVQVSPSQGWSISDWDASRGNVPVDTKTFSMRVFDAAVGSTGHVADTATFPSLQKDASADMGVSFWMAPQRNIDGRPQVADVVVTAEFEDLSVYAILYNDGELVFQQGSTPEEGRAVTATYAGVETATSRPWDNKAGSIKTVTFNCNVAPVSTGMWFYQCSNLTTINGIEKLDTSAVSDMFLMFGDCSKLTSLDVTGFDTSNVTNMCGLFAGCSGLTFLDVTGFDTSNVTDMGQMFYRCKGLMSLDVSRFDTSSVAHMNQMFCNCSKLTSLDVTGFDTSKVINMGSMFNNCSKLTSLDVAGLDTSKATDMSNMFCFCSSLTSLDVTDFDTGKVTDMSGMFSYCSSLASLDVSGFDTGNVTNMSGMFQSCSSLTSLDVTEFDTSKVTDMNSMFYNCSSLVSLDMTGFDTSNVTTMARMFGYCSKIISLDLTSFDTSKVSMMGNSTLTGGMFRSCSNLITIYATDSFVTTNVTDSNGMFSACSALVGGNGTTYSNSHTDKEYARIDIVDTPGYFTAKPINVTVEDHTNAAATVTEPSNGWRLGANTFSVSSEKVCAVGLLRDGACTELGYSSESGADHVFKADLREGDAIVVVLRGDADVNGRINPDDSNVILRYLNGSYNAGYANILAMDVNRDGKVNGIDSGKALSISIGSYVLSWKSADAPEPPVTELTGTFDNTEFTLGQSDTGEMTGTLSFAYDDTTTRFDGFTIDFDWTELKGATDILDFYSGTYFDSTWDETSTVFTIAVTTDGVSGKYLADGTSNTVDISTLSQFVSTVVGYNGNSERDYELLELTFLFNENLAPGTYEVPITIRELYDGSNADAPVYYADEDHPIHLTAILEVPEMAAATMDATMLDGMAAPGLDAVTGPAEPVPELPATGDGTYEVDPDTEVVEVPETPVLDVEPETPEVPTEPSEPEGPAEDPVEVPDEGATEPDEEPGDVPATPDVEPSQDPEPAAKPDEEGPAPDAGNQDGDGEGAPDAETPEDAQPPATDGEAASDVPEDPGQD